MLLNAGIKPLRLNILNVATVSIGLSIAPTHEPFTKIFVIFPSILDVHSCTIRIVVFARNHLIIGTLEAPLVTNVLIAMCLCNPMLPPSGVSTGSM